MDKSSNAGSYIIQAKYLLDEHLNILKDKQVIVEEGLILEITDQNDNNFSGYDILKFPNGLIAPPFINSHTHLPETLIRGICDDQDLHTWLFDHVWKVEPHMNKEDAYYGSLLGIAEMISSGTIGFVDQFYFSESIVKAAKETGVKALLAPSIFDGNAETQTIEKSYKKNLEIYEKFNGMDNRIFVGFGPHATYSIDLDMMKEIGDKAIELDTFIHIHLNETEKEVSDVKSKWNMTPIELMADLGYLGNVLAAHCTITTDNDMRLLKQNNTTVLHNLQSNLKLGSGIAPIPRYLELGINVVLGTDGNASNNNLSVLEEVRFSSLIHKGLNKNPNIMSGRETFKMGTSNNQHIFPNNSYRGKIAKGNPADLVVYNLDTVRGTPVIDPMSNLIYSISDTDVQLTVSNGKILYRHGEFLTLNIEEVKRRAQSSIERMLADADYK